MRRWSGYVLLVELCIDFLSSASSMILLGKFNLVISTSSDLECEPMLMEFEATHDFAVHV